MEYDKTEAPCRVVNKLGEVSLDKPEPVNNLITWVYETGPFVPCAKIVGNETFSIINDYIGRPILAFNEKGEKVWSTDYDIYSGLRNLKGDRTFIPFRQLGQYEDVETGLYYNRFRYDSPESGLYISKDPISILGGLNVYAYVKDSNGWVDVFGLFDLYRGMIETPNGPFVYSGEVVPHKGLNPANSLGIRPGKELGMSTNTKKEQIGKKLGKHIMEYGLNRSSKAERDLYINLIHEVRHSYDERRIGPWLSYRRRYCILSQGKGFVDLCKNGIFVTLFKQRENNNERFKNARGF